MLTKNVLTEPLPVHRAEGHARPGTPHDRVQLGFFPSWERCHLKLGRLTTLEGQSLSTIPSEVGNLGRLTCLNVNDSAFTAPIPAEIGRLARGFGAEH